MGSPIMVQVGKEVSSKMFDIFGNTLDGSSLSKKL
jgi:F0F1-type ATP synthase beta subunit